MSQWKIVTDTGSCLRSIEENIDFAVVPLMLNIDNEVFVDTEDLPIQDMLDKLLHTKTKSSSACPSPEAYAQHFQGADNIICFTITGKLSGSYNSALLGKDIALETNPDANIHVYDTCSAGGEMDLIIKEAARFIDGNPSVPFEDVVNHINEYHQHSYVTFLLESVKNLVNNGRVSKLLGQMIGLLGIRLVGTRTPEGEIELANKAKGQKRGIKMTIEDMKTRGYNGGRVEVTHVNNEDLAKDFTVALTQQFPQAEVSMRPTSALCSFYAEHNGMIIGFETK